MKQPRIVEAHQVSLFPVMAIGKTLLGAPVEQLLAQCLENPVGDPFVSWRVDMTLRGNYCTSLLIKMRVVRVA